MAIVYRIIHKPTLQAYIGSSVSTLPRVKSMHKRAAKRYKADVYSPSINYAIYKEGIATFAFETLLADIPLYQLPYWETHYIAQYDTFFNGYNTTLDGKPHSAVETQLMLDGLWPTSMSVEVKNLYRHYFTGTI